MKSLLEGQKIPQQTMAWLLPNPIVFPNYSLLEVITNSKISD